MDFKKISIQQILKKNEFVSNEIKYLEHTGIADGYSKRVYNICSIHYAASCFKFGESFNDGDQFFSS